jgi:RNA polymerase sigma factor (sigma-70 family)
MPEEVPAELQEKFMDLVDSCIYKTIHNTKTNYERRVRKNKKELILNQICNDEGDERVDSIIGSEDVECHWDFMNSIENDKLFDALSSLSERERELIKLKFNDDYSYDEITELLGCKKDFVRQVIHRAVCKMRNQMTKGD